MFSKKASKANNQIQYPRCEDRSPRVIPYANVIEAIYYLKENPNTTFIHPIVVTRVLKRLMTEDEKAFLKTFKLNYVMKK